MHDDILNIEKLLSDEKELLLSEKHNLKTTVKSLFRQKKRFINLVVSNLLPNLKKKSIKHLKRELAKFTNDEKLDSLWFDIKSLLSSKKQEEKVLAHLRKKLKKYLDNFDNIPDLLEIEKDIYLRDEVKVIDEKIRNFKQDLKSTIRIKIKIIDEKIESIKKLSKHKHIDKKILNAIQYVCENMKEKGVNYKLCDKYINGCEYPEIEDNIDDLEVWLWHNLLKK